MHKLTTTKRIEPKKLIQHATNNLNSIASQKYDVLPNFVEENKQQMKNFTKFLIFKGQLKFKNTPKDKNVTTSDKTIKNIKN